MPSPFAAGPTPQIEAPAPHIPFASSAPEIRNRIVTPYNATAFKSALHDCNLTAEHPNLVHKLRHGFSMGVFPDLKNSVIFDNYTSDPLHTAFIDEYLDEECDAGPMSGPYTREEVEGILGPFQCSPILVNIQEQDPGVDPKL